MMPDPSPAGPRVMVVSHAYTAEGPRRQMDALAELVTLRLVAPPVWKEIQWPVRERAGDDYLKQYQRIRLFGHQYLLASTTLGLREFRPDVIHVDYDPWSAIFWQVRLYAFMFARSAPIVAGGKKNTFRRYPGLAGRVKGLLARLGLGLSDQIEAASQMSSSMYQREFGLDPDRIAVLTHVGVDVDLFSPADSNEPASTRSLIVGYCGQYAEHKGVRTLFEAVQRANGAGGDVTLELLGAGPMRADLERLADQHAWLTVHGPVESDQVADFLRTLDAYVLPAHVMPDHEEHDGHALLQALSCGLPSIGTRSGIVPEILGDGVGLLVDPENADRLSEAIMLLAEDPVRRHEMSLRSRQVAVSRYSYEVVASLKADRYQSIVQRRRGS